MNRTESDGKTQMNRENSDNGHFDVMMFDLGGVLVRYKGVQKMLEWTGGRLNRQELWDRWLSSPAVRCYETGQCSAQQFADELIREFELPVSRGTFLEEMVSWLVGDYPGVDGLLKRLSKHYRLVAFSNINELFWKRIQSEMTWFNRFDHAFASYAIGLIKPDLDAYRYVLERVNVLPGRILYFDDHRVNIEAAQSLGVHGLEVSGIQGILEELTRLGI